MGNNFTEDTVYCLNVETGAEVWQYLYPCKSRGQGTQATPTIDGKYIYTLSAEGHLHCLKAKNGKVQWVKNIVTEYGAVSSKLV